MRWLLLSLMVSVPAWAGPRIIYGVPARIASLNPYLLSGVESYTVTGFVIEPLARIEPFSQTLQPWLAREWKVDAKKKIVRVKLRQGVKFHNGEPLTAEDVRFTWKSYFDPAYKGDIWRAMWSEVEDVKVADPLTVEFHFKDLRYQTFQNVMTALRVLPRSHYAKVNHEDWTARLIGTGPFQVARFESSRTVDLSAYPDWWGWKELKLSPAPSVLVKSAPDAQFAEIAWRKKELDVYLIPSGETMPAQGVTEFKSAFGTGFSLGVNFRVEALKDQKVRQALLLLWNRSALNDKVYGGRFKVSLDSFAPLTKYYPSGEAVPYDLTLAKKLLSEAGFNNGKTLTLKVLTNSRESERWVGLYQTDAAKAGVKIVIEKVADEAQWWQLINQGKYELVAYDGAFSEQPHSSVWHSKGAYNSSGIKDQRLDEMLDQLDLEFDETKRKLLIKKAIRHLREVTAELPGLFTSNSHFLIGEGVTVDASSPLQAWRWRKKD